MPVSYVPFSGADLPFTTVGFNTRFQSMEDYFLAAIAGGAATQQTIEAVAGEGLSDRAAAYLNLSDNKIYLMDSDATGPKAGYIRGFVDGVYLTGATATLVIGGLMDGFSGLTAFLPVYVASIAGTITQTRPFPTSGGNQVMVATMGFAVATDTVIVRSLPIQYQKRDMMALNDLLTVQHHADDRGYLRNVWAYITENDAGAAAVTYASANRDEDIGLEANGLTGYTADLCTGGTPSASSEFSASFNAAKAFDDLTTTAWAANSSTTGWIRYDFGAANDKRIERVTLRARDTVPENTPKDFTIQGSADGSSWTTIHTPSAQTGWTASEQRTFTFTNATAYRYWRLNITTVNAGGTNINVGEIEMMAGVYATEYDKLAQTFTLAGDTDIASVGLWLKKTGSPTGTATLRIETVDGSNNPTGTLADAAATQTFAESGLGTSYAEQLVTFASEFTLSAGTYALVLSTSRAASGTNFISWGADGSSPSFSGGEMKSEVASTWSNLSKDAIFTIYNPGLSHPSRVAVDYWNGSHADMVNRFGDGSGASLSTQTTFKCVLADGFDDITVVVEIP